MRVWEADNRVTRCESATLLWTASRVLCDTHWRWNDEDRCYETHEFDRANFYKDLRQWPAATPLASLLRAVREDERLADLNVKLIALDIASEYLAGLLETRFK